MTTNLRDGFTAAAVTLMTLASASTAHAALSTPVQIDPGGSGWTPAAAVNGGTAVVGLQAQSAGLKAITSAGNGQWNPAITLTSPTAWASGAAFAVDADGNQTAIWGEYVMVGSGMPAPGPVNVRSAHRTATGAWSAAEQLSPVGVDTGNALPAAVAAPDGRVTVTWSEGGDFYSATRPANGAWSARTRVTAAESAEPLDLAVAKDGTVTAIWRDATSDHAMSSTLAVGGAWSTPVDISGTAVISVALDMTSGADATAVWSETGGIFASRRPALAGAWTAPQKLSANGAYGYYAPGLDIDATGRATVAWFVYDGGGNRVFAADRAADGTWGPPINIGSGLSASRPAVGTTPDGEAHVAWYGMPTRLVTRAADGTWGSVTTLPAFVNADPVMATDEDGDSVLVGAPNASPVQVAGFDNAGPGLHDLSVPATTPLTKRIDVSVAPIDLWSGLGTVTWSFGDGTTATGTSATHQYSSAGTKKVTVTATDAFGRARSRTRAVTVLEGIVGDPTAEPPADPTAPAPPVTTPAPCTPRTSTTVKWTLPKGTKVRRATITVSGQKVRVLKRKARSAQLDLRKAKGNVVTVTVRTRTTKGKLLTKTQRYTVCA